MPSLKTTKDIRNFVGKELASLYNKNEMESLSRIIIKTVFYGRGLHEYYDPGARLTDNQSSAVVKIVNELKTGKPYQYISGESEFYNCIIEVSPAVLIPRPETEELVDLIIKENIGFKGTIADMGTGSGCIAIALAINLPGASVTGFDLSPDALVLAKKNAERNNAAVDFEVNDILDFRIDQNSKADIIVSNPPYVRKSESALMKINVTEYEPSMALYVDDSDPLIFYRHILEISKSMLSSRGKIYFEINEAMGDEMIKLTMAHGFSEVTVIKDLNNKDRFVKVLK